MNLSDRVNDFTQYVIDLMTLNQHGIGLMDIWDGDQNRIPRTPCLAVEPGIKSRSLVGAQRQTEVQIDTHLLIYVGALGDTQINQRQAIELGEAVESILHTDARCGGLAIHSMVTSVDPGYALRGGTQYRACRLTFQALTRAILAQG